jgi:3-hydroxyacyl-CoA dehydrogenase/enoyl-CoA hydratase/3-hydroxybutyryl-CoA epimerase
MNDSSSSASTPYWKLSIDADNVAWLDFDKPSASTNTLSRAAMIELGNRLAEIESRRPRALIVASAKQSGFIAGADIKEFTSLTDVEEAYELVRAGQKVLDRLAALPCPTVAAVNGFTLGGGLELALACQYRIAADDPKVVLGLPEIQLGIHPGFGGTIRTVHLLGPVIALDLILTGRNVRADKALKLGLVDQLARPDELRLRAKQLALSPPMQRRASFTSRLLNLAIIRPLLAKKVRATVARRAPQAHYPAPYAVIDLWRRYGGHSAAAYEAEARSIAALFMTSTSRNLVRIFLLQDRLKNLGNAKQAPKAAQVHVIGAGVMGGDIATWCASRGLRVSLQDRAMEFVEPALQRAREFFSKRHDNVEQSLSMLQADIDGGQAAEADVVIEAIYENAEAKRELYARVEPKLKSGAVLATNTSSIVLETLMTHLNDPGRFVGLHFFNPVARMPLVEVIRTAATRPEVLEATMAFVRQLDKLPLPCRSAPGFVVNRILMPYLNEAMLAAEQGVPYAVIDKVATGFGMPMGPIELADVVGLDVAAHVGTILAEAFGRPAAQSPKRLLADKHLGKKTGRGFYVWQDGKPVKPAVDVEPPHDLEDRLILPMLNEAVAVLREGVVEDADLVDAGVVFGTGFAPFRGGPLRYAQERGTQAIVKRLDELAQKYGPRFQPDSGWQSISSA